MTGVSSSGAFLTGSLVAGSMNQSVAGPAVRKPARWSSAQSFAGSPPTLSHLMSGGAGRSVGPVCSSGSSAMVNRCCLSKMLALVSCRGVLRAAVDPSHAFDHRILITAVGRGTWRRRVAERLESLGMREEGYGLEPWREER